jgi:cytochrome c-type biogenesis protein CcmH
VIGRAARVTITVVGAVLLLATAAAAATPQTSLSEISSEVMCPVCGTLLELAESPQAQREKAFIERLVEEGKSKQQIKDTLVAEYGDEVLALPQDSGFSLSAYVVPIVAFLVAAIALAFGILRWRRASGPRPGGPAAATAGPSPEDNQRLDEDLGRYDL